MKRYADNSPRPQKGAVSPKFNENWQNAVLLIHVLKGLPTWASERNTWRAQAALNGWSEERCQAAFQEAERGGMIETKNWRPPQKNLFYPMMNNQNTPNSTRVQLAITKAPAQAIKGKPTIGSTAANWRNNPATFELVDLVDRIVGSDECPPLILWGETGIGKSAVVRQLVNAISTPGVSGKPEQHVAPIGRLEVINGLRAALTGWSEERCRSAFAEADRKGMFEDEK